MSRISYLKQHGYSWSNLRMLYTAIMNHIEKHEASWVSDWRHIEDMVLESAIRIPGDKGQGKSSKNKSEQWYCCDFNKIDGCNKHSPHDAVVRGRRRQVKHFCAKCWLSDHEMHAHAEVDPVCLHHE